MFIMKNGESCMQYVVEYFDVLPPEHQEEYRRNGDDPFGEDRWSACWSFEKFEDALKTFVNDSLEAPEWRSYRVKDMSNNSVLIS